MNAPTEREVEIAARIQAQDYMLATAFRLVYGALGLSEVEIETFHRGILAQLSQETFREYSPTLSDHYSSLVEEAVANLLKTVEALPNGGGLPKTPRQS